MASWHNLLFTLQLPQAREDGELHPRVGSRARRRIRDTLARLKSKGEQRREEGEDR